MTKRLPIVVVGSGTAGSLVVSQLAANTSREIILIEPGVSSTHDDESRFLKVLEDDQLSSLVSTTLTDGGNPMSYRQAQALGGGSAVNGMLLTGDAPAAVDGLTRMAELSDCGQISRALLENSGRLSRLWWNAGRWNPGRAVRHLEEEGRITVVQDKVTYIDHSKKRATAVHTSTQAFECDSVVLTAGALSTPEILLRSGLTRLVPAIGEGLQNHPTISFTLKLAEKSNSNFDTCAVKDIVMSGDAIGLITSYERVNMNDEESALLLVSFMNPSSRGAVWISDSGVQCDFNMLATKRDRIAMREAVHHLIDVAISKPIQAISTFVSIDEQGTPLAHLSNMTNDELDAWIEGNLVLVSHAASSCSESVDGNGKVIGVENMYIADASILVNIPSVTPASAVVVESLRIAQILAEEFA
jgi:choline dehydrogenase-like flavoprotein